MLGARLPEDFLSGAPAPGWFGKIPALGDFAARRLAPSFTERWDVWLAGGLEALRLALGQGWLESYLRGPIWRFALTPTLIDDQYWFGVVMPSVDRVGRYFPLTIASCCAPPPGPMLAPLEQWLEQIAQAALGCLAPNANVESLETKLAQLALPLFNPPIMEAALSSDAIIARLATGAGLAGAFANGAARLLVREYRGASFWWPRIEANPTPALNICRGLPATALLVRMLSGAL